MLEFDKYAKTPIKVTKLLDNKFGNDHPNKINEGYVKVGHLHLENSNKHQCLFMITAGDRFFHTSQVEKIEEREGYDLLHTLNSVYKVEPELSGLPGVQEKYSVKID